MSMLTPHDDSNALNDQKEVKPIKCIVWDLDHTLWDGILAEGDQVELKPGITDIIKQLDARGILHSIASKNNYDDAMARLQAFGLADYFLYPQISWSAKSQAIHQIQQQLNIGIDSFLFIDDQIFEREEVNAAFPEVTCLDAIEYTQLPTLERITAGVISDDAAQRRIRYLEDMQRSQDEQEFIGAPDAFLATLNMQFRISLAGPEDLLRAEELTVRTNQLNSTGVTYDMQELAAFMRADDHELLVCELQDKYGSYGKIGLVLLQKTAAGHLIKLLLMSCRVASRGVGSVLLTYLAQSAANSQVPLLANFRRTPRNRQMLITYQFAGFKEISRDDAGNILFEYDQAETKAYPDYIHVITDKN